MTRSGARWWVVVPILVLVAGAGAWWFDRSTRPDAIGPRFTEALLDRHRGATIDAWNGGVMRITLASGVTIAVRLRALFDACGADRFACSSAVSAALDEVDRADRATRDPQRAMLRPTIVDGSPPGFTLGYVTEPVIGRYELRYALVDGLASTFVTSAIADRLGSRTALKADAFGNQRADAPATLEALPGNAAVHAVRSTGDPTALLLDRERMKAFATQLGATRLYALMPGPAALYLAKADEDGAKAMANAMSKRPVDLLVYDPAAAEGRALTSGTAP